MVTTTSGNLVAGNASAGQGGNGKGRTGRAAAVVATAALGLSLVVGGILGQGRQARQEAAAPANTAPIASGGHVATLWDFREDRRAETRDLFIVDQFAYREDHRAGNLLPASVLDTIDFGPVECGIAPCVSAPAAAQDQRINPYWVYGEDVILNGNPALVAPPTATAITGETPCATGGTAPCGLFGEGAGGASDTPPGPTHFPGEDH